MITLYQSYFAVKDETRRSELDRALKLNIDNQLIDRIVLLTVPGSDPPVNSKCEIVELVDSRFNGRCDFGYFFSLINKNCQDDDISIIANSDISFDDSLVLVNTLKNSQVFAVTRHEDRGGIFQLYVGPDSQDAWCFRGRVRDMNDNFRIGLRGSDNRLAYELVTCGYEVINPCRELIITHHHASHDRDYWDAESMTPGPYLSVPF